MIEIEEDYIVKMLPVRKYKIELTITIVKKGELNIVERKEVKKERVCMMRMLTE